MVQSFGVRDTADILRLTRPRFIARHVYVEGIEKATLEEKEAVAVRHGPYLRTPLASTPF